MQRQILATALMLAALVVATATDAEANTRKKKYSGDRAAYEAARAHSVDPAGTYGGYPDWARWALSPKSGGRGLR